MEMVPARGVDKGGEHLEHGALASAIGADKADDLALVNGKADLVNCGQKAVAAGDGLYADHVQAGYSLNTPQREHGSAEIGIGDLGLVLLHPVRPLVAVGHWAVRDDVALGNLALPHFFGQRLERNAHRSNISGACGFFC